MIEPIDRNIDRYLVIWQAVNPDGWYDPATKKLRPGLEALQEDLLPFFKPKQKRRFSLNAASGKGDSWTSEDAADTKSFGYTYPDILESSEKTKQRFRSRHGWSIRPQPTPKDWKPVPPEEMLPLDLSHAQVYFKHLEYLRPNPPQIDNIAKPALRAVQTPLMKRSDGPSVDGILESVVAGDSTSGHSVATSRKRREWFVDDAVER